MIRLILAIVLGLASWAPALANVRRPLPDNTRAFLLSLFASASCWHQFETH